MKTANPIMEHIMRNNPCDMAMLEHSRNLQVKNEELINNVMNQAMINVLYANHILLEYIVPSMIGTLKEAGFYKQKHKQHLNMIEKEGEIFSSFCRRICIKYYKEIVEGAEKMNEILYNDIFILRMTIKRHLDRLHYKDSNMLSFVLLVDIMSQFCISLMDSYNVTLSKLTGKKFRRLNHIVPERVREKIYQYREFVFNSDAPLDLTKDVEIMRAFTVLTLHAQDLERLREASGYYDDEDADEE